jgi:hypothetical protein
VEAAATEVRRARRDELGGAARLVPNYLPLDVPHVKAGDVELDAGSVGPPSLLNPSISICVLVTVSPHPSQVSPLPGPPHIRGMWSCGSRPSASFARIRRRRVGLSIAEHLAAGRGSTCQIHQGLTASGGLDGGRGAGERIVFARPGHAKLDLGPMPPEEACPVIAAVHDRRSQDESERGPAPASRPSSA